MTKNNDQSTDFILVIPYCLIFFLIMLSIAAILRVIFFPILGVIFYYLIFPFLGVISICILFVWKILSRKKAKQKDKQIHVKKTFKYVPYDIPDEWWELEGNARREKIRRAGGVYKYVRGKGTKYYKIEKIEKYVPPEPEYPPNCINCGMPIKTVEDNQIRCKYCSIL